MRMTTDQLCEDRNTLFEIRGALSHEAMNAGNNIRRFGYEKIVAELAEIIGRLGVEIEVLRATESTGKGEDNELV